MSIKQDIREILHKHYKHPDKLELNDAYLILHKELVEYMQNKFTKNEREFLKEAIENSGKSNMFIQRLKNKLELKDPKPQPCQICGNPVMPNKYGNYNKSCSDECKSELLSRGSRELVKQGRTHNGWRR